jgi:hypothetical protein
MVPVLIVVLVKARVQGMLYKTVLCLDSCSHGTERIEGSAGIALGQTLSGRTAKRSVCA